VPGQDYVSIVTGDHFGMGKKAAELMADAIGGAGRIGYIFHDADYYVTNNRDEYFKAAIEQLYPDIEIVAEQGFTDEGSTQEIAAAMIAQNPDLDGIYVAWSAAAQASSRRCVRPANRRKVVAYDPMPRTTSTWPSAEHVRRLSDWLYLEGKVMVDLAAKALLGQEVPFVTVEAQAETRRTTW
jgi:ribose transport system substrate-binding protein